MTPTLNLALWAKLGNETWPEKYHPVLCHLIDVAAVTRKLWDAAMRPCSRQWLATRLGLDEPACAQWLAFWCGAHDIGKVSFCFQVRGKKTEELEKWLKTNRFDCPIGDVPHGTLSTTILADELANATRWPKVNPGVARNVAVAVGGHHGVFPTNWDNTLALGNEAWTAARRSMLAELGRLCGVTACDPPKPAPTDDQSLWMCVAGLTSVADWIGSNQQFFPSVGEPGLVVGPFDIDRYFDYAIGRAHETLETLGWLGRADTTAPVTFAELFPSLKPARPLQDAVAEIVMQMNTPGLVIVEAPMGEGKTEAAWYAAECWDRRGGQGTYVALPTMATSNQMFDRVGGFLQDGAGKKNLMLQHGKAALNEQFEKLKYAALVYDQDKRASAVLAEAWFAANKKHGLLAPYGVGTIDQALLAVLQTKHVFVRLFGLAGKCVILDEVHAYDAYMTTLMERLLRWLAALGCPVVLLSATLPAEKRLKLLRAYAGNQSPEPKAVDYPRVTHVSVAGSPEAWHITADPTRARTVGLDWVDEGRLAETLRESLAKGGCAAVIRNTVGLAQATYLELRDVLRDDGITVELFHARFLFGRRMEIENSVLKRFGKDGGPAQRDRRVLVATQVIEQSLDLDFDVMVSDVAPADLVLQRAGRLHRHERGPRPTGVAEPHLWLIEPTSKDGLPDFGPAKYVYAPFVLMRSYLAFKALKAVQLPKDLERLVEQVYGSEPLAIPEHWRAALQEASQKLQEKEDTQQLNAIDVAISDPDASPLELQSQQLEDDDHDAAKKIQALTRDAEPTIQVVVIYHIGGRDYLDPAGLEPFDERAVPDVKRIRRLLDNEVTISHGGCFAFYAPRSAPKGWKEKGMVRYHRIVRVDSNGKSLPTDFCLAVDHELGVRFTAD